MVNPYFEGQEPHYLIQINNTGCGLLSKILQTPPSVVTVRDAIKRYGQKEWDSFFTFTLVRNPYARAASLYGEYYYANKYKMLERDISFVNFLNLTLKHKKKPYYDKPRLFMSQWEWLVNFQGELGVDSIGRYEQFDIAVVCFLSMLNKDPFDYDRRPIREANPYRWERYYEGADGKIARGLIREYWADDFTNLNYKG